MTNAASKTLAAQVTDAELAAGLLFPSVSRLRDVSFEVATCRRARGDPRGVTAPPPEDGVERRRARHDVDAELPELCARLISASKAAMKLAGCGARLQRGYAAAACVATSRQTAGVIDAEFAARRAEGAAIACAAGCAFCCHQRVGVYAHEAVALLSRLRALESRDAAAIEARIRANARAVDGMTAEQHRATNLPCAFLVEGRYAAYEVRPLACARYHSLSRARCEHAFAHPEDAGTPRNSRPALAELEALGDALAAATDSALEAVGLSTARGELHQLLRALLENPAVVERWSAGEDIAAIPVRTQ